MPKYNYEGIAFYAYPDGGTGATALERFYNSKTGAHFYTISADEAQSVKANSPAFNYEGKGYQSNPDRGARLVAAIVPKPLPVTGWALPNDTDRPDGGAKSTHLAVPAGAVYYFEAEANSALGTTAEQEAAKLAAALNWHGSDPNPTTIKNRRSTLMGEKGFGLGVCGTWTFHGNP